MQSRVIFADKFMRNTKSSTPSSSFDVKNKYNASIVSFTKQPNLGNNLEKLQKKQEREVSLL